VPPFSCYAYNPKLNPIVLLVQPKVLRYLESQCSKTSNVWVKMAQVIPASNYD